MYGLRLPILCELGAYDVQVHMIFTLTAVLDWVQLHLILPQEKTYTQDYASLCQRPKYMQNNNTMYAEQTRQWKSTCSLNEKMCYFKQL